MVPVQADTHRWILQELNSVDRLLWEPGVRRFESSAGDHYNYVDDYLQYSAEYNYGRYCAIHKKVCEEYGEKHWHVDQKIRNAATENRVRAQHVLLDFMDTVRCDKRTTRKAGP